MIPNLPEDALSIYRKARTLTVFVGRVERAFERKNIYLRQKSYSDDILAAIFVRATKTVRAMILLVKHGHGADSTALCRSLVDDWLTVRWITNQDNEARARLLTAFGLRQAEHIRDLALNYDPGLEDSVISMSSSHKQIADRYKKWDKWGPGAKAMAEEVEILDAESWINPPSVWTYNQIYFSTSCYLHVTPVGIAHISPKAVFKFESSDEEFLSQQAINLGATLVAYLADRISLFWGLGISDEIARLWGKFISPILKAKST